MHVIFLYVHEGLKVPFYTKQLYNLWKPTIYLSAHLRSRVFTSCHTILCSHHKHTDQSTLILPHSNWILKKFWHSFISPFLSKLVKSSESSLLKTNKPWIITTMFFKRIEFTNVQCIENKKNWKTTKEANPLAFCPAVLFFLT